MADMELLSIGLINDMYSESRTVGERCFIDGFSERIYRGYGAGFCPICLPFVSYFFDHDIIDAVNISIKKRNSTFMQAQVVLEIICN